MPDRIGLELEVHSHWYESDEQYVRRGELIASMSWLSSWRNELEEMNDGKRGRPYRFPRSLVRYVRLQREVWHLSLRAAQGALRALGAALGFEAPDFTTLWKRLSKEEAEPVVQPRSAIVAVDSTGFSTTVRGEWLRAQWRKRRSFVKERMVVDVETLDILCVIVTDDTVRDAKAFAELVQQVLD